MPGLAAAPRSAGGHGQQVGQERGRTGDGEWEPQTHLSFLIFALEKQFLLMSVRCGEVGKIRGAFVSTSPQSRKHVLKSFGLQGKPRRKRPKLLPVETPCLALGICSPHHGRVGAGVHPIGKGVPSPLQGSLPHLFNRTSPPEVGICSCSSPSEERGDPARAPALSVVSPLALPRGVRYCPVGPRHKGRWQHLAEGTMSWSLSAARFPSDLGIIPSSPWACPPTPTNRVNVDVLRKPPRPCCSHVGLLSGDPRGREGEGGSEASRLRSLSAAPHVPPQPGQPLWALGTGAQE